jgi:tripartite-type tricarboxylate transporter receptor subunit TctC
MIKLKIKKLVGTIALGASLFVVTSLAHSFEATSKPVNVVIPFAPGGGVDLTFRHLQKYALERGITMVAVYRPGADGLIAMRELATMPRDGFNISVTTAGVLANQELRDADKCCTAITGIRDSIGAFVVHPGSPINTLDDLERAVKQGDNVKFGFGAPGQRMVLDQFFEFAKPGRAPLLVPYKGGGPVVNDLLAGHIDVAQVPMAIVKSHVDTGKLRLIATIQSKIDGYASVPMIEDKYPKWKELDGFAVVTPAGANPEAIKFWTAFLKEYTSNKQVQQEFAKDFTITVPFGAKSISDTVAASKARLAKMEK